MLLLISISPLCSLTINLIKAKSSPRLLSIWSSPTTNKSKELFKTFLLKPLPLSSKIHIIFSFSSFVVIFIIPFNSIWFKEFSIIEMKQNDNKSELPHINVSPLSFFKFVIISTSLDFTILFFKSISN